MTDRHEPRALDDYEFAARVLAHIAANPPPLPPLPSRWHPIARRRVEREYRDDLDSWTDSCMIMANDLLEVEHALDLARQRDALREAIQ